MPIYEYRCRACRNVFCLMRPMAERDSFPPCQACGAAETDRRVSLVRRVRSEDEVLETMADPTMLSGLDENDPMSVARWAKKMAKEMGEDLGEDIEQMAMEEMSRQEGADPDSGACPSPGPMGPSGADAGGMDGED